MSKDKMINDTTPVKDQGILDTTLKGMEEFDMNKMNDPVGSHPYQTPKPNKSK
jgi:hypothetical protein